MKRQAIVITASLVLVLGALTYIPAAFANPCQSGASTTAMLAIPVVTMVRPPTETAATVMPEMAATPEMAEVAEVAAQTPEMPEGEQTPVTPEIALTASEAETFVPVAEKRKVEMVEQAEMLKVEMAETKVACA